MQIPLINKGKLKTAIEVKPNDYLSLTDNVLDTARVHKIDIEGDSYKGTRVTIETWDDETPLTIRTGEFKPDHSFAIYETYHQKG